MGFISKDLTRRVAQRLDNLIRLKGIAELVDGPVLKLAIDLFDETLGDRVPIEYRDDIIVLLEAFADDDYSKVTNTAATTVNKLIDIPGSDEDLEQVWLAANLQMLGNFILHVKNRRQGK
jgi:hypothetical protein